MTECVLIAANMPNVPSLPPLSNLQCTKPSHCSNCDVNDDASSGNCVHWQREQIIEFKHNQNVYFPDVNKIVQIKYVPTTYASVTKSAISVPTRIVSYLTDTVEIMKTAKQLIQNLCNLQLLQIQGFQKQINPMIGLPPALEVGGLNQNLILP